MKFQRFTVYNLIIFCFVFEAFSLRPVWYMGMLLFENDPYEIAIKTRFMATVCGVETWYNNWEDLIEQYIHYGPFYASVPDPDGYYGYSYKEINEYTLTDLIWDTPWLYLESIPKTGTNGIQDFIIDALQADNSGESIWQQTMDYWDPYYYWKWRSVYIETMHASNHDTRLRNSNCWGTANYLMKGYEWVDDYAYNRQDALNMGIAPDLASFPNIFCRSYTLNTLNGYKICPDETENECCGIDDDLHPNINGKAELCYLQHVYNVDITEERPWNYTNAFDVIRHGSHVVGTQEGVGPGDMAVNYRQEGGMYGQMYRLLYNDHSAVYICTDEDKNMWCFDKRNPGATWTNFMGGGPFNPYRLVKVPYATEVVDGITQYKEVPVDEYGSPARPHGQKAFFAIHGDTKEIIADSYNMDYR